MSISVPPPEYQFTGLIFNPDFWVSSSSSLTQDVANQLYLRKTVTDTASALETFNGGIKTNDIAPTASTTNLVIAPSLTSGELFLGVNATATNGRINHIHIGDANNLPAGAGVHINNGTTNASNTNISNGATTSGNVNIMTGATSTGTINLGGSSTVIQVNRPLTLGYTVQPSATQLGYIYTYPTITTTTYGATPASQSQLASSAPNQIGVWLVNATATVFCDGAGFVRQFRLELLNNSVYVQSSQIIGVTMDTVNAWTRDLSLNVSAVMYGNARQISFTQSLDYTLASGVGMKNSAFRYNFTISRIA